MPWARVGAVTAIIKRKSPPLRVITNSEVSAHACPRLHHLRYVRRLSRAEYGPAPTARGTLHHRLLTLDASAPFYDDAIKAVVEPWIEERMAYVGKSDDDEDLSDADKVQAMANRSANIHRRYRDHWRADDSTRYETIAKEVQVAAVIRDGNGKPIRDTVTVNGKRQRRTYVYAGALDRVVRDLDDGSLWLMETKTTKDTDLHEYARKLSHDAQTRGYVWATRNLDPNLSEIKEPIHLKGVIYDVIRDKEPSIPATLSKCQCKHSEKDHEAGACTGSKSCTCTKFKTAGMSKAKCDTTWPVYRSAVEAAGLEIDDYGDVRAALHGAEERFFARIPYPFTDDEVDRFGSYAQAWALRTKAAEAAARDSEYIAPPNSSVCLNSMMKRCPGGYEGACLMGAHDEDALMAFAPRGVRHIELHGVLAEEIGVSEDERKAEAADPLSMVSFGGMKPTESDDDFYDSLPF